MNNATAPTPRPHEGQDDPDKAPVYLYALVLFAFVASSSIWYAIATKTTDTLDRIGRLETHGAEITARVVELERRVLAIERPDRAVFAPGHPGRIGTAPGTEAGIRIGPPAGSAPRPVPPRPGSAGRPAPQSVPPRPGSAGRGTGGEGPPAQPAQPAPAPPDPPATTDPNAIRDA